MTRDKIISLFFLTLLLFVVYQIFHIFSPFFEAVFWAAILAFAFHPLYSRFIRLTRISEMLAAIIFTFLILLIVIPPIVLLIINTTSQAIDLYQSTAIYIRDGHLENLIERIRSVSFVQKIESSVFQWEPLKENATTWVLNASRNLVNLAVTKVGVITKNIFFITLNTFFASFLLFVFLKDGQRVYTFIYQVAPLEEKTKVAIFKQINETFSAVLRGQMLTSITQAVAAGIIFSILGLPAPIFFAGLTFFSTLIPVIGAVGIWLPICIYLFTVQEYTKALILCLFGILFISMIDNIMKPALIGEKTKLPYFLLFFGILGGMSLYGLMGIFLAPVVLSLFFALVKIYRENYL